MLSLRSAYIPAAFAALLLTLSTTDAHAFPSAKDREDAKSAIAEARVAIGLNRFADAAKALKRADELDPNPQTKIELADALSSAGKLIEATQILNLVIDASPPPPKKQKDTAKSMLEALEQRIPWIQIKIIGPEQKLTSTTIDGKEIDAESEIPFNPGSHVIGADADGYNSVEKKIKLKEGAHLKVKLKMERDGAAPAKPKAKPDSDSDEESSEDSDEETEESTPPPPKKQSDSGGGLTAHPFFLPGVITGGAGVLGLVIGTAFGAKALSTTDDLKRKCGSSTTCDKTAATERLQADALSQGNVSTAMFIVGGAATAAGGVLLILAMTAEPPKKGKEKAFVMPYVGLGQAGVVGSF